MARLAARFVFFAALVLAGCQGREASRAYGPPGDTLPRWEDGEAWEVREVLRVGGPGSGALHFGRIDGLDVDSRGRIVVLDAMEHRVVVLDADGGLVRTFGREGRGPGEFGNAARYLFVGPGDTVFVPDVARRRLHVFDPEGQSVASPRVDGLGVSRGWAITDDGRVVEQLRLGSERSILVERDRRGGGADTVRSLPLTRPPRNPDAVVTVYRSQPAWDLGPDGTLVVGDAWTGEIELGELDAPGSGASFRFPFVPDSVTDADRAAILDLVVANDRRAAEQGYETLGPEEIEDAVAFASRRPAFQSVMLGPEATVWVRRIATPEALLRRVGDRDFRQWELGGPMWEVFDTAGDYLGRIEVPTAFTPYAVSGRRLYGSWRDPLDVEHVMVLEVSGAGEPTGPE